jgi:PAS domain S-box-containing protein
MHYISHGCEKVFGESVQQVLNDPKNILSKIHPEDIDQFKNLVKTEVARLGRFDVDYRIVTNDGTVKWIKGRASCRKLSDEIVAIEGIALDVTRQKELEFEQSRLALIASRTSNAVILTDLEGRITWVNDGFERITEFGRDEVLGKKPGDLLQGPNTDKSVVQRMSVALTQGVGFKEELLNYSKRGRPYWLQIEVMPVKDSEGRLTGFMAIETDITNLKNAILEMQRSESALHAFMNHAPLVAFIKDDKGRYTFFNRNYRDFMKGKELLAGYTDYDLFDKEFADLCVQRDNHIIQTGELLQFEHHVGDSIFLEYKFPLRDPYNKIFAVGGISLDITEKIETQKKILENEARLNNIIQNLNDSVLFQYLVN